MAVKRPMARWLGSAGALLGRAAAVLALMLLTSPYASAVSLTSVSFTATTPTQTAVGVVYVKPGEAFTANVSGNTNDSSDNWRGTGWRISTTSGAYSCFNNTNLDTNNASATLPISMTAPASAGTYNIYFQAYTSNSCTGASGGAMMAPSLIVVDATAPTATVSCNSPASCGSANPTNATSVSWTVTFDEAVTGLATSNFTLSGTGTSGASITGLSGSGTTYTVTATTGASGTLGLNLSATLTGIFDRAGNNPGAVSAAAGNTYTIDKTGPTISPATIASNNAVTTIATTGNTVTLSFTTTDTSGVQTPVVTIAGRAATVSGGPTAWTASTTMLGTDTEGTVPFTINVSDALGNAATQRTTTTNGSSVTFDRPPTAVITCSSPSACDTGNPTKLASVSWLVTFSESVSGVTTSNFTLSGSSSPASITGISGSGTTRTVTASTGGDGTLALNLSANLSTIVDAGGNSPAAVSAAASNTYTIDKTAPVITAATISSSNVTTTLAKPGDIVTLSFTTTGTLASPPPVVTIAGRTATISGGPTAWVASQTMASGDPDGVIAFVINVSDVAGNAATPRTLVTGGTDVTFDGTLPTATITCSNPALCGTSNPTASTQVTWAVAFGESVTGVTSANFGFSGTGTSGATLASVAGSGSSYTVTANTGAQGTLGLNLAFNLSSITDAAGNAAASVVASASNTYTISTDNSPPVATISCSSPLNCGSTNPTSLASVTWAVTFSSSVTGVSSANFSLSGTGTNGATITGVSGSGTAWFVTATTGDDGTLGLNLSASLTSIVNSGGNSPAAVSAVAANTYTKDSTATGECFIDDFARASLGSDWATSTSGGSYGLPRIVSNRLQLTNSTTGAATAAHLQRVFPASGNKVVVEFDYYGYNGNGADGVGVTLSDANVAPVAGAFGGSLGYAQKAATGVSGSDCASSSGCPGFAGGWIGVGIDEYGNFSAATEGRIGGSGVLADAVVVRGSGSGLAGYNFHTRSSALSPGIDVAGATAGPGHRYRITVDHTDGVHAYVTVERDTTVGHTGYTTVIPTYDAKAMSGQAAVPTNWFLSYTASTGAQYNTHEVASLKVCTTRAISVPTLDHVRIVHDGGGLTCAPETVTLKACADASCSSLYLGSVTSDINSTAGTWSQDPVTFTGGQTTVTLTKSTTGNAVLSGTVTSPSAASSAIVCYNGNTAGACTLPFSAASCAFDAVEVNKAPSTNLYTKLAGTAFNVDVVALTGGVINTASTANLVPELVDQSSTLDSNGCGTTVLATATPANYTLVAATDQGRKTFSFNYANAARDVRIKITSGASTACSTDNFAIRPASFAVTSSASNSAATGSPIVKAGAAFTLAATPYNSVASPNTAITAGYTGAASYFSNLLSPHDGFKTSGEPATTGLLAGTFAAAHSGTQPVAWMSIGTSFTYTEAGSFKFLDYGVYDDAFTLVDQKQNAYECFIDAYLGTTHALAKAPNTVDENGQIACFFGAAATSYFGRFVPDHFDTVITQVNQVPMGCPAAAGLACPVSFNGAVYSRQPFKMSVIAKRYGALALAGDGVVTNYDGATWARNVALSAWGGLGTTAAPAVPAGSNLTTLAVAPASFVNGVAAITDQTYQFSTFYSAAAPSASANWAAPANVYLRADEVAVAGQPDSASSRRTVAAESVEAGVMVISGRMYVPHMFGSEMLRLRVPVLAQYWNGTRWVTNFVDSVSTFSSADVVRSRYTRNVSAANSTLFTQASAALVNGSGSFTMQATGAGNVGSVDFNLSAPAWLPSTVGRARVGTYRSPLIYLREVY